MFYDSCIPEEMKALNCWSLHRSNEYYEQGNMTKKEYNNFVKTPLRISLENASSTDSATWCSFKDALGVIQSTADDKGEKYGMGFELGAGGITCIDFDHCLFDGKLQNIHDKKTNEVVLSATAIQHIIERVNSYTEISPSGTGIHIFVKGNKKFQSCSKNGMEIYSTEKFIRMTGCLFTTAYDTLNENQASIDWLGEKYFSAKEQKDFNSAYKVDDVTKEDIIDALSYIDVRCLNYNQWTAVATVLWRSGIEFSVFDDWSAKDSPERYSQRECKKKWEAGFNNEKSSGFTASTIFYMAKRCGYIVPERYKNNDNVLPKKWTRPDAADNDDEITAKYVSEIDQQGQSIIENKAFWDDVLNNASRTALNAVKLHMKIAFPRMQTIFKNAFSGYQAAFYKKLSDDYIASLTPMQKKAYDSYVKQKQEEEFPELDDEGKPKKDVIDNVKHLLNLCGYSISYNEISTKIEVAKDGKQVKKYTDRHSTFITDLISDGAKIDFYTTHDRLDYQVETIAVENAYNPFVDYLKQNHAKNYYHGITAIQDYFNCFYLKLDVDYTLMLTLFSKWLLQSVYLAFNNGNYTPQGMLGIKGPQHIGKSTALKKILPQQLLEENYYIAGKSTFNPDKKDDLVFASRCLVYEIQEFNAATVDVNLWKGFITKGSDEIRPAYGRDYFIKPRMTNYCFSVNDEVFLKDTTGNRRFWVIPIKNIDRDALNAIDINLMWAEVYNNYLAGKTANLTASEIEKLEASNDEYRNLNPVEQFVYDTYDFDNEGEWINEVTATDISKAMPDHLAVNTVGRLLKEFAIIKHIKTKTRNGHGKTCFYLFPPERQKKRFLQNY